MTSTVLAKRHQPVEITNLNELVTRVQRQIVAGSFGQRQVLPSQTLPKLLEVAQHTKATFGSAPYELVRALRRLSDAENLKYKRVLPSGSWYMYQLAEERHEGLDMVLWGLAAVGNLIKGFLAESAED